MQTQKILIIDDTPDNLESLGVLLRDGYELLCALSGEEGIDLALRQRPDLILLDVMMPELDGYEVCSRLKADLRTNAIPIIFITALDNENDETRGLELGAIDYVTKPINIPILRARIRNYLELKRIESALQRQTDILKVEVAGHEKARELLQSQQRQLETLNGELEERVATEVKKCREKDQVLMENEKMVSLGLIAAGVAHEINNPMGYIVSNLHILADYFHQIVTSGRMGEKNDTEEPAACRGESRAVTRDMEFILVDGADLIRESLEGAGRVTKIVQELKAFSRNDATECKTVTLVSCLESALTVAANELKYVATVRREYESDREVCCNPGQLGQVFLNLLVNAGHAIVSDKLGEIVLRSWHDELFVYVSVEDTGGGIPEEIRARIFDPFFTTKEVGKGTGLGLSVSRGIMEKHRGELLVESVVGVGTTFTVKLPYAHPETA